MFQLRLAKKAITGNKYNLGYGGNICCAIIQSWFLCYGGLSTSTLLGVDRYCNKLVEDVKVVFFPTDTQDWAL